MVIGKLRQRVELQSATASQDGFGEPTKSWSTAATVWAAVEDLQGREFLEASQLEAEITTRIRMRAGVAVTPGWRALHGSDVYDVKSVGKDPTRARELQLMCVRAVT